MQRVLLSVALLAAAAAAWQVNLWPVSGSSSTATTASTIPPVVVGDCVVVAPVQDGPVFVVNTTSQTLLWGKSFGAVTAVSVVPATNVVAVSASDLTYAFDLVSGKQLWISDTVVASGATLVSGNTIVLINSGGGGSNSAVPSGIVAVDSATGKTLYTNPNANGNAALISIDANTAAFFDSYDNFNVFSIATGKLIWTAVAGSEYGLSFVTRGEGNIALANTTDTPYQPVIVILDAATGVLKRTFNGMIEATEYTSVFHSGYFYATISPGIVQAYDLTTGYMHWQYSLANQYNQVSTPYFTSDYFVTAAFNEDSQQVFYFFDLKNGTLVSTLSGYPSSPDASFVVVGNFLVIPNLQGVVIVDLTTETVVYRNEDMPSIGQTGAAGIVASGNELVFASATAVYGVNLPTTRK